MSKGKGYYDGFFGDIMKKSDRNGKSYDTIYPLNTPNTDTKLRFAPWSIHKESQTIGIEISDKPLPVPPGTPPPYPPAGTEPELFFTSQPLPLSTTQESQTRVTSYGDFNTPDNNYFAPYYNGGTYLQPYNAFSIMPSGSYTSMDLKQGPHSLNMRFVSNSPAISGSYDNLLCSDNQFNKANIITTKLADWNASSCKWRTDQEAFACCTAQNQWSGKDPSTGQSLLQSNCATSFMPNGESGSICPSLMLNVCENNWQPGTPCYQYLQSFVNNADVANVVQTLVRNYINGQAERTGCGTNQYTTPNSKWKCKNPETGKYRDDSKDEFISHTLGYLCTADGNAAQPGFCDLILNQYCAQFTREDLLNDKVLQNICGCHLTGGTGGREAHGNLTNLGSKPLTANQYPYPGITTACDPICNYTDTIPYSTQKCDSTVCILDDVNINIVNSDVKGDVNINQVCEGGGKGKRSDCYISGVDIDSINSSTGGVVLKQGCNACFAFCPDDGWSSKGPAGAVKVDCGDPATSFNCNMCKGGKCKPGKGPGTGPGNGGPGYGGKDTGYFDSIKQWTEDHPYWSLIGGVAFVILFALLITLLYVHLSS
jgi:Family of unknown function (DUF5857)